MFSSLDLAPLASKLDLIVYGSCPSPTLLQYWLCPQLSVVSGLCRKFDLIYIINVIFISLNKFIKNKTQISI